MLNPAQVQAFFDSYAEVLATIKAIKDTITALEGQAVPPAPTRVATVEEWNAHVAATREHETALTQAKATLVGLRERRTAIEADLAKILPARVWFQFGTKGIGKTSAGSIEVAPWSNLPELG